LSLVSQDRFWRVSSRGRIGSDDIPAWISAALRVGVAQTVLAQYASVLTRNKLSVRGRHGCHVAIELARLRNLVKVYGDTYDRGRQKYQKGPVVLTQRCPSLRSVRPGWQLDHRSSAG